MIFEDLNINDTGLKVYICTKSKSDIQMLRKILHGLIAANYQKLDSFENYDLPIGDFSLEYNLNTETIEIEILN